MFNNIEISKVDEKYYYLSDGTHEIKPVYKDLVEKHGSYIINEKAVYKCCYNCDGGMLAAVPANRTEANADYYDRMIDLNKCKRFCGINYRDNGYAKDAFKQRYCKDFEVKLPHKGSIITKKEANEMGMIETKNITNRHEDSKIESIAKNKYCFVQDDSCHWYCISVDKKDEFYSWVEATENGDDYNEDFEDYRLEMHVSNYSFENMGEI